MPHQLEQRIGALRTHVRFLVVLYGLSWVVAAVLGAMIVLGLTDYLLHFQDRGVRVICSLLVLAALAWTCYRYLYLALRVRLRDVDLGLRLERRFPELKDRLVSSVEFLRQSEDDPTAGSPALRRAVIAQTAAETDRLDFADVLDYRPPVRAVVTTVAICLVAAILVVADWDSSRRAVARLLNPLSDWAWPQTTHLRLRKQLSRVARGDLFKVEVVAAPRTELPREVRIHYRFQGPDGTVTEETKLMDRFVEKPNGGKGGRREVMIARRENVLRPFSYRAEGGDDNSMPWISVELVEPPEIQSLAIRLTPPQYTGWPPEQAGRSIRALVGTRVQIAAKTTKPLQSAVLCIDGGGEVPGRVSDDGYRFTVPAPDAPELVIDRSAAYWFELKDRRQILGGSDSRGEIRAVPDTPPTVTIEQPTDNLFVTSQAVVLLRVAAKDDLAVRRIALVFSRTEDPQQDEPEREILYSGPEQVEPQPAGALSGGAESGDRRVVDYSWDLAGLGLTSGTQVTFHAAAFDYRPGAEPGKSEPRRLIVITPEELQERIADRQGLVLAELARVLKMQRGCRSQVSALEIRLEEIGQLEQFDVDHLQAAELNQRQVNRSLTSRSEGVPGHILALLADLENNKVDSPDISRRMQALLTEIDRLEREHLAVISRELTAAIKVAQVRIEQPSGPPQGVTPVADSLGGAGKHQDAVIASLEEMLGGLARWDNYRRFHREIGQLLRDQEELSRRTTELGRRTLTKGLKDLQPQERADLKILTGRQLELARRLDRIEQEMEQAGRQLQQSDPLAAETVADALEEARRLAISGQMRSCGGHLGSNQIGQAVGRQKQIEQDLREVLDILANRRRHELARLVEKLREAEVDLAEIERRQSGLRKELEENLQQPDDAQRRRELQRLAREQQQVQEETERMARRLQRLLASAAGDTTRLAAGQMAEAGQSAGQGKGQEAAQQADQAEKTLKEARHQLAQRRLQAQAELAAEQLARLEDALKHLRRRQQNVLGETLRFAGLQAQGPLTRPQTAGLRDLARQQRALQSETVQLGDKLLGAGAFNLALLGAGRDMGRAAALLERYQTGTPTQQAEQNALNRLDLVLEALKPEEPDADSGGDGGDKGGQMGAPGGGVQTLAELKLLKLLQEEINHRTAELQEAVAAAEALTDQQRREYLALSEEQGRLAELVLQLLPVEQEDPEDDPAGLPDLRLDQQKQPRLPPLEEELP